MSAPRTYTVGLPVVVTVHDDGRVDYWVDTAEAGLEILDSDADVSEEQRCADVARVDADHDKRLLTGR